MKTFKMISFQMEVDGQYIHFPLEDGLLINQENSHQTWILEAFIASSNRETFDKLLASEQVFNVRTVISFPDNDAVTFRLIVATIKEIGPNISVLMKGSLVRRKRQNPTELLESLMEQNIPKEQLVASFQKALAQNK